MNTSEYLLLKIQKMEKLNATGQYSQVILKTKEKLKNSFKKKKNINQKEFEKWISNKLNIHNIREAVEKRKELKSYIGKTSESYFFERFLQSGALILHETGLEISSNFENNNKKIETKINEAVNKLKNHQLLSELSKNYSSFVNYTYNNETLKNEDLKYLKFVESALNQYKRQHIKKKKFYSFSKLSHKMSKNSKKIISNYLKIKRNEKQKEKREDINNTLFSLMPTLKDLTAFYVETDKLVYSVKKLQNESYLIETPTLTKKSVSFPNFLLNKKEDLPHLNKTYYDRFEDRTKEKILGTYVKLNDKLYQMHIKDA